MCVKFSTILMAYNDLARGGGTYETPYTVYYSGFVGLITWFLKCWPINRTESMSTAWITMTLKEGVLKYEFKGWIYKQ